MAALLLGGCGASEATVRGGGGSGGTGGAGGSGGAGGKQEERELHRIDIVEESDHCHPCLPLLIGDTIRFVARPIAADGRLLEGYDFRWSSSDESIATVVDGAVTAIAEGTATIVAEAEGVEGTIEVPVTAEERRVHRLRLYTAGVNPVVTPGQTIRVEAFPFLDELGTYPFPGATIEWSIGDAARARVAASGSEEQFSWALVELLDAGEVEVTVTSPQAVEGVRASVTLRATAAELAEPDAHFDVLAAAGGVACGLDEGRAFCWGANGAGQLGIGEAGGAVTEPAAVAGGHRFSHVSAGGRHTCAVDDTGAAWCWGENSLGQLGLGTTQEPVFESSSPAAVAGGHRFRAISAGSETSCGIDEDGRAWCWGQGSIGQLGTGNEHLEPVLEPVAVDSELRFERIVPAGGQTCALDHAGKAWCWGAAGPLLGAGRETAEAKAVHPGPIAVAGDRSFVALDMEAPHACALDAAGAVWCWGTNGLGALGRDDDELFTAWEPVAVHPDWRFASIATGVGHTCGLDDAGAAWCWGSNELGQLGDGSLTSSAAPVRVFGALTFVAIEAGGNATCGRTADGAAWCWGSAMSGELGAGLIETNWPIPLPVSAPGEGA